MKKLAFLIIATLMISSQAFTQDKTLTFGVGGMYTDGLDFGAHGRVLVPFNEDIDLVGGFTYFFKSGVTMFQINADGHYQFAESDDFGFYGLAGINYYYFTLGGGDGSHGQFGLDIGGGVLFKEKFFGEIKYDGNWKQLAFTVGMYF